MNKKISLSIVAALCVSLACMSFYSVNSFSLFNQTPTAKAKPAAKKPAAKPKAPLSPEEKSIHDYLTKHKLKAKKTASGLYYVIATQGTGAKVAAGKNVQVNYTGTLLDGTKFDSSTDPAFGHVQPLPLKVGVGQVIKGWDEGLQLFNVGGKGTLVIPAGLAYGPQANGKIPANSVLVFEVEIVSQQ